MTDDDKFFERLRGDAAPLRYEVDAAAAVRIRERIHERIAPRPSIADVIASWLRPLTAGLAALAIAAVIGLTMSGNDAASFGDQAVEIVMGGDTYVAGN